jgi:serine phosphatase RsbU (regulator of sigma subunit)
VITEDLAQADIDLQAAQSIVAQRLRAVVVIPLYAVSRGGTGEPAAKSAEPGDFLGVVYLDSRRPAAFSRLDRQILDALAVEAAAILDNARLVQRELERRLFEQELKIAREIQQALLPHDFGDFPHLSVSGVNLPSLTASGDYYDVFPVGPDRTGFLIADVSGKGLGAALLTTMLQGALLGVTAGANASGIFASLNQFLCEHSDVGRYATMFFGIVDSEGRMEFINAGHPSPVLLRRGEASRPFAASSTPVGLIRGEVFDAASAQFEPGDTVVLFSDGVTEAMALDGELFGTARLSETLTVKQPHELADLQKAILDAIANFTRGASQHDDITLLLVRYLGPRESK